MRCSSEVSHTLSVHDTETTNQQKRYVTTYSHLSHTQCDHHQEWCTSTANEADDQLLY